MYRMRTTLLTLLGEKLRISAMDSAVQAVEAARRKVNFMNLHDPTFRRVQLTKLLQLLRENKDVLMDCLQRDYQAKEDLKDIDYLIAEINHSISHIDKWTRTENISGSMFSNNMVTQKREAVGVVLIVADDCYPLYLSLLPLPAAIAAGNTVIVKPSQVTPLSSTKFAELIPKYLDENCFHVVHGDESLLDKLLTFGYGHVVYMGREKLSLKVYEAAYKNCVPVTGYIRGKNPVFMDESCDVQAAAKFILQKKLLDLKYPITAPDYVLCTSILRDEIVASMKEMCSAKPRFLHTHSVEQFTHLKNLLLSTKGRIVIGGDVDDNSRQIALTVVADVPIGDPLLTQDFSGPILPISTVLHLYDAMFVIGKTLQKAAESTWGDYKMLRPTVTYAFTNKRIPRVRMMQGIPSDTIRFMDTGEAKDSALPSEMGVIRGEEAFKVFTRLKTSHRDSWIKTELIGDGVCKFVQSSFSDPGVMKVVVGVTLMTMAGLFGLNVV